MSQKQKRKNYRDFFKRMDGLLIKRNPLEF